LSPEQRAALARLNFEERAVLDLLRATRRLGITADELCVRVANARIPMSDDAVKIALAGAADCKLAERFGEPTRYRHYEFADWR
jgi:hypothetical protein